PAAVAKPGGRGLAGPVARAGRVVGALAAAMAGGAARRAVLAPRVAPADLRSHRLRNDDRRRVGGRVSERDLPDVRGAPRAASPADRAVEPRVDRDVSPRSACRPGAGDDPVVRSLAPRW